MKLTKAAAPPAIQTKLKVGEPDDVFEQEADDVAEEVMRMPDGALTFSDHPTRRTAPGSTPAPGSIQRMCAECAQEDLTSSLNAPDIRRMPRLDKEPAVQRTCRDCEQETIQRNSIPGTHEHEGQTEEVVTSPELTAGGAPLSRSLRTFYESRLGYDLSAVRLHTGAAAEHLNQSLQAYAFTYRNHIWLGAGQQPAPSFCLAHELAHTIQQSRPRRMGRPPTSGAEPVETPAPTTPGPLVQRKEKDVYWLPRAEYFRGKPGNTGKKIQDRIYADFTKATGLKQEVNIPNAARKKGIDAWGAESGLHVKYGIADLYLAEGGKPIGLYFTEDGPVSLKQPERLGGGKAPRVTPKGEIVDIEQGPKWVRIGEIKAASAREIKAGEEQVHHYLEGIKLALHWTNVWATHNGQKGWPLAEKDILPLMPEDFKPDPSYTFQEGNPREELVLDTVSEDKSSKRPFLDPREDIGQRVMGGLYVHHRGNGVWAYFARPADPDAIVNLPGLTEEQTEHVQLAQTLQNEVVDPIKGTPVQPMTLRKPGATSLPTITHVRGPGRIQRAVKEPPRVRDTFSLKQVTAARKKLHDRLKAQEKTKPFEKLRFIGLAYEAEEGLDQLGLPGGGRLPDKNKLAVTLKTEDGKPGAKTVKRPLATLYRWLNLWTNPSIDILARFRSVFGATFVTVADKVRAFKENLKLKLSETFDRHAGEKASGTSYLAVAVRAIGRGLKAVAEILIPQTLRLVVESLISGAKERLLNILPLDIDALEAALGSGFQQFDFVIKKVEELKGMVDTKIQFIKDELGGYLSGMGKILDVASDIASTVKWSVRAIQCASPPAWGCLKLIFSSLTAWIAEKVLNYCPLQREVACAITGIQFVQKGIPKAIANAIGKTFNGLLHEIDPRLSPLFKELTDADVPPLYCSDVGCEGQSNEWDLAFDRMQAELESKHGSFGAARMMDSLIEMSRMFGPGESDGLSAAEIDDLRKLLMLYEITPAELDLIVEDLKQQKQEGVEVRRATVKEFGDAIERHRESLASGGATTAGSSGGSAAAGDGGEGVTGGTGEATPGGTPEAGGGGVSISTEDFSKAKYNGPWGATVKDAQLTVKEPDLTKHTRGAHKVTLVGYIQGVRVKEIENVPVYVSYRSPWRVKKDQTKYVEVHYQLHVEGVLLRHHVPNILPFGRRKGRYFKLCLTRTGEVECP